MQVLSEHQYGQVVNHPYALTIGKILVSANEVKVDGNYIPPCFSVSAHPDLVSLYAELDQFLGSLEVSCSQIVQKILRKNQQNEISELVMFLCDRIILYLSQSITTMRWALMHESPSMLFASIASLSQGYEKRNRLTFGLG